MMVTSCCSTDSKGRIAAAHTKQGCSGAGTRVDSVPHFFDGGRIPHFPHFFGLKFVQKLVHCCNWLLTETQCKIISVQQTICYRHSNTSRCIAGRDQRSAVAISLTSMSVRVCRPKLLKNLCLKYCFRCPPTSF